jgi:hypothetical protein
VQEQALALAPQVQPQVQRQAPAWVPALAQVVARLALVQVEQQQPASREPAQLLRVLLQVQRVPLALQQQLVQLVLALQPWGPPPLLALQQLLARALPLLALQQRGPLEQEAPPQQGLLRQLAPPAVGCRHG